MPFALTRTQKRKSDGETVEAMEPKSNKSCKMCVLGPHTFGAIQHISISLFFLPSHLESETLHMRTEQE